MWVAQQIGKVLRPQFEAAARYDRIQAWRQRMIARHQELMESIRCLADNLYNEAGYETTKGMVAVATVVMNRVADPAYPKTVCGVVYQRTYDPVSAKVVCQFSWTCQPTHPYFWSVYKRALIIAREVIIKNLRLPGLQNVVNYHADYVHPGWGLTPVMQIGPHIFYASNTYN